MVSNTQKAIRSLKTPKENRTAIATEMFLPNHSGDHSAGVVLSTPVNNTDIVNKAYVDAQVASEDFWNRVGTIISPKTSGDILAVDNIDDDGAGRIDIWSDEVKIQDGLLRCNTGLSQMTFSVSRAGVTFMGLEPYYQDGVHWGMRKESYAGNHNTIWTSFDNIHKNHDHGASEHPTIFIHSKNDPDTDNTQWSSITHNGTDLVLESGSGGLRLKGDSDLIFENGDIVYDHEGAGTSGSVPMLLGITLHYETSHTNWVKLEPQSDGDFSITSNKTSYDIDWNDGNLITTGDINCDNIDATGDINTDGEMKGARCLVMANYGRNILWSTPTSNPFFSWGATASTSTYGLPMARAGSIVDLASTTNCSAYTATGTINVEVHINGISALSVTHSINKVGVYTNTTTQARGTDTFVAGDMLQVTIIENDTNFIGTTNRHFVSVGVQFDT